MYTHIVANNDALPTVMNDINNRGDEIIAVVSNQPMKTIIFLRRLPRPTFQ